MATGFERQSHQWLGPGRYSSGYHVFYGTLTQKIMVGTEKCILTGPNVPTSCTYSAVPEAPSVPAVPQHTAIETVLNMTPENKEHFLSAKSANPLALLAAAQPYSDNYYQAPKPPRSNATSSLYKTYSIYQTQSKREFASNQFLAQSESVSEEDSDPEQAQRDKDMQKNLALLVKYFKRLYKPTNNNL
ncbi:hypothetical protein Tco_1048445 [Tanacetum coccineum]